MNILILALLVLIFTIAIDTINSPSQENAFEASRKRWSVVRLPNVHRNSRISNYTNSPPSSLTWESSVRSLQSPRTKSLSQTAPVHASLECSTEESNANGERHIGIGGVPRPRDKQQVLIQLGSGQLTVENIPNAINNKDSTDKQIFMPKPPIHDSLQTKRRESSGYDSPASKTSRSISPHEMATIKNADAAVNEEGNNTTESGQMQSTKTENNGSDSANDIGNESEEETDDSGQHNTSQEYSELRGDSSCTSNNSDGEKRKENADKYQNQSKPSSQMSNGDVSPQGSANGNVQIKCKEFEKNISEMIVRMKKPPIPTPKRSSLSNVSRANESAFSIPNSLQHLSNSQMSLLNDKGSNSVENISSIAKLGDENYNLVAGREREGKHAGLNERTTLSTKKNEDDKNDNNEQSYKGEKSHQNNSNQQSEFNQQTVSNNNCQFKNSKSPISLRQVADTEFPLKSTQITEDDGDNWNGTKKGSSSNLFISVSSSDSSRRTTPSRDAETAQNFISSLNNSALQHHFQLNKPESSNGTNLNEQFNISLETNPIVQTDNMLVRESTSHLTEENEEKGMDSFNDENQLPSIKNKPSQLTEDETVSELRYENSCSLDQPQLQHNRNSNGKKRRLSFNANENPSSTIGTIPEENLYSQQPQNLPILPADTSRRSSAESNTNIISLEYETRQNDGGSPILTINGYDSYISSLEGDSDQMTSEQVSLMCRRAKALRELTTIAAHSTQEQTTSAASTRNANTSQTRSQAPSTKKHSSSNASSASFNPRNPPQPQPQCQPILHNQNSQLINRVPPSTSSPSPRASSHSNSASISNRQSNNSSTWQASSTHVNAQNVMHYDSDNEGYNSASHFEQQAPPQLQSPSTASNPSSPETPAQETKRTQTDDDLDLMCGGKVLISKQYLIIAGGFVFILMLMAINRR